MRSRRTHLGRGVDPSAPTAPSTRRGPFTPLLSLLVAGLFACGEGTGWSASSENTLGDGGEVVSQASQGNLPPFFDRVVAAPYATAFRGTRRVVLRRDGETFDYLEEVGADGTGRFAVEVPQTQALPPGLDPTLTTLLLEQRARFGYRVRDPHITDLAVFAANWRVTVRSRDTVVAGHPCWRLEVERVTPLAPVEARYELDVEPRTGLVLGWRELDTTGLVHAEVVYQTLTFGADVSAMDLRDRDVVAVDLDPLGDLAAQVGAAVHMPNLPPPGFVLEEVELLTLSATEEWLKFVYTDGFERAYFLHAVDRTQAAPAPSTSHVAHAPFGNWTFALGQVQDVDVIVAGKVPAQYLADLIQSAIR